MTGKGPLSPYRVLDITDQKAFLCGRILADLGADVIKIEPPGGDAARMIGPFYRDRRSPDCSLSYWAFNTGKRSVELDLEREDGQASFRELALGADFIVESLPPGYLASRGLAYESLRAANPALIMTSITPFGSSGPQRDYKGGDLVALATGGLLYLCGDPQGRPAVIGVPQSYNQAGAQAAVGTLIAHYHRQVTGQGQWVDVSAQEAVINSLDWVQQYWDIKRVICKRGATPGMAIHRNWTWECRDGHVSWVWWVGAGWGRKTVPLIEWMAEEGLDAGLGAVPWEEKSLNRITQAEVDAWEEAFRRFFARHTVDDLVAGSLKRRILLFPIAGPRRVAENAQLKARGFFFDFKPGDDLDFIQFPGPPARATAPLWGLPRPAPRVGQHTREVLEDLSRRPRTPDGAGKGVGHARLALDGLKVADFTWLVAGPATSKYLALFGATVVKVEHSRRLDGTRQSAPFAGRPTFNNSGHFANPNTSKMSLSVDLTNPKGVAIARKLIEWADVVVENFTPGVMARWGLDYESMRRVNPGLVMLSSSFQGQTGPAATQPGYASLLHAVSGINHLNGWPGLPPTDIADSYGDSIGVWFGLCSILAALDGRRRSGQGMYVDLSQLEAAVHFMAPAILDYTVNGREWSRQGNRSLEAAPHGVYRCLDAPDLDARYNDRWCAIAAYTEEQWLAMRSALGNPPWADEARFADMEARRKNTDALDDLIGAWTRGQKAEAVMHALQQRGVPAGVVANARDLHEDPQLAHRGHFVPLEHPTMGRRTYDAPSFRLSETPHHLQRAPLLGEQTQKVVCDLLGVADAEFVELLAAGVLEQETA